MHFVSLITHNNIRKITHRPRIWPFSVAKADGVCHIPRLRGALQTFTPDLKSIDWSLFRCLWAVLNITFGMWSIPTPTSRTYFCARNMIGLFRIRILLYAVRRSAGAIFYSRPDFAPVACDIRNADSAPFWTSSLNMGELTTYRAGSRSDGM